MFVRGLVCMPEVGRELCVENKANLLRTQLKEAQNLISTYYFPGYKQTHFWESGHKTVMAKQALFNLWQKSHTLRLQKRWSKLTMISHTSYPKLKIRVSRKGDGKQNGAYARYPSSNRYVLCQSWVKPQSKDFLTHNLLSPMPSNREDVARKIQMPQCKGLLQGWTDLLKMCSGHCLHADYRKEG